MNRFSATSILIVAGVSMVALAEDATARECSVLLGCAGMELAQGAGADDAAPDGNSAVPPDSGSDDGNSQAPRDNDKGDDGGAGDDDDANPDRGPDQASPPDTAQPPGCIFRNEPLDLLV